MMAKQILPDDIAVQIPPNLADAGRLIRCGVDDLGGVSPLTIDYVNPSTHGRRSMNSGRCRKRRIKGEALYISTIHPEAVVPGATGTPYYSTAP